MNKSSSKKQKEQPKTKDLTKNDKKAKGGKGKAAVVTKEKGKKEEEEEEEAKITKNDKKNSKNEVAVINITKKTKLEVTEEKGNAKLVFKNEKKTEITEKGAEEVGEQKEQNRLGHRRIAQKKMALQRSKFTVCWGVEEGEGRRLWRRV